MDLRKVRMVIFGNLNAGNMIVNRMISSNAIVAKLIADLDLNENDLRISDIKEYIMEGMLKIGAVQQYEHKVAVLDINGHLAALPCDLYQLDLVAYSCHCGGGWLSMRKATSSFGVTHDSHCCGNCCGNCCHGCCKGDHCDHCKNCMIIPDAAMFPIVKNMYNLTNDRDALDILNKDNNLRHTLSALINVHTEPTVNGRYLGGYTYRHKDGTMYSCDLQYTTKPGYIVTNAPEGYLKISYYAIYTDEDSMPMIPDMESYKEALYWYITMKLMYPKKLKGLITQQDYYDIRSSWNFYRKQAYAEAMMPGTDGMESLKNSWNKLYPEINDHDTFFSTTGEEQNIYNLDY